MKRLYCAGTGADRRFCLTSSLMSAADILGDVDARLPTDEDVKHFWETRNFSQRPSRAVARELGVTHQTVCNWRTKACRGAKAQVPSYRDVARDKIVQLVAPELTPGAVIADVSRRLGLSRMSVARVAQELGFESRKGNMKRPKDEDIIRLAEGRNWRELAEACGVSMGTLRNYVYARPELSQVLRERMKRQPTGAHAQGKVDPDIVKELHRLGVGVTGISRTLGVDPMTVMHWLDKLGLRKVPYIHKGAKSDGTDAATGVAESE